MQNTNTKFSDYTDAQYVIEPIIAKYLKREITNAQKTHKTVLKLDYQAVLDYVLNSLQLRTKYHDMISHNAWLVETTLDTHLKNPARAICSNAAITYSVDRASSSNNYPGDTIMYITGHRLEEIPRALNINTNQEFINKCSALHENNKKIIKQNNSELNYILNAMRVIKLFNEYGQYIDNSSLNTLFKYLNQNKLHKTIYIYLY